MQYSNSHKVEKILRLKQLIKGMHRCMICISGNSRVTAAKAGKNQFVRMRRSVGC